jgi:hypothetical protein
VESLRLEPGVEQFDSDEVERLSHLAGEGTFAAVLGPGIPPEPGHGIRGIGLRREPQPESEWAAIIVSPGFCEAVAARQGADGVWDYGETHDWTRVVAAARSVVGLLGAPDPRFLSE